MYCTGGVRCEKAAAWFATDPSVAPMEIGVLEGGIVAYAEAFGRDRRTEDSCVSRSGGDDSCAAADAASRGFLDGRVGDEASVSEFVSIESVSESVDPANEEKARSRFLGSNFVFDNRGVVRVTPDVTGWCDGCEEAPVRVRRVRQPRAAADGAGGATRRRGDEETTAVVVRASERCACRTPTGGSVFTNLLYSFTFTRRRRARGV
jgi:hypothetical protein